ncbi:MAG: 3-isopropylmalate dehydrogenase [Methanothermococcus sp.]|uniref:bifunctional 3-isopropylmalate/3-methylmalate dehydrogenase n=1 Tax=Methanothermococcus TaxID=155862 RepID=UPI00037BFBAC|nr:MULTISPECIES: bifunctional 3-isopropylmalate/3-methylmalate dehydrogenase [Methanothermococcus]MDK2791109.1 3-isopropylmalate dehydrogenase [Methanothermococcus sp.]
MYRICVIEGDGIGKEVVPATVKVLEATGVSFEFIKADAGDEVFEKTGIALPEETVDIAKKSDAVLFGAAGETAADVIVKLRKLLDTYANVRPVKSYKGINCLKDDIDYVIVRENTEGLYKGLESEIVDGVTTATRVITRNACEKIFKFAFELAKDRKKQGKQGKVTCAHKANVLKLTDGLFKNTFYDVAKEYSDIISEDYYIDAMNMYIITKPETFDVVVTSNLFGDILSDGAAGMVGGLGMAPSGNIGDKHGLFEPVHGSAPDIAGKGIANPTATILTGVMMLRYLGENEAADRVEKALEEVLEKGLTTPDLGGNLSTFEMAEEVAKRV